MRKEELMNTALFLVDLQGVELCGTRETSSKLVDIHLIHT